MFGIHRMERSSIQKDTFFPIAMGDKAWFLQLLAFASLHRDRVYGISQDSPTTTRYLAAAIRAINDDLSNPTTRRSLKVAGAISSAAYIELAVGRMASFEVHVRALSHMLRVHNPRNAAADENVNAVLLSHLVAFCKRHVEMTLAASAAGDLKALDDAQELEQETVESLALFEGIIAWWKHHRARTASRNLESSIDRTLHRQQRIVFSPKSIVMQLLRGSERSRSPIKSVADNEEAYILYSRCFLVLALWEYRDDPLRCHEFLSQLLTLVLEHQLNQYTIARLGWLFFKEVGNDNPERRWTAISMVRTLFSLESNLKNTIAGLLLKILEEAGTEQ